ncbi:Lrp/AsnC family transcriptional regulator [Yinghuangia aomiensis]|uniref:Lrp/AsnC family transcriptional regulator n=1 Tax=Yinghuangia aomiensis TaxID=676205 RepID=A0ABP9GPB5_9ACTN
MESSSVSPRLPLDGLDRAVVHALEIDGRAPFSRIAAVLGVSEQTVARRYRRLAEDHRARVVGRVDPRRIAAVTWLVRIKTMSDAATAIAEALARRPDTSWVEITSGGTEVHCLVRNRGPNSGDDLLLRKLPRTPKVAGIQAQCVLHIAFGGPGGWMGKMDALTEAQAAALRDARPPVTADGPIHLDAADDALFAHLGRDGRAGYPDLAAATGLSESAVRRRVEQLRREGVLFFEMEVAPGLLGHRINVWLHMSVPPTHLAGVLTELSTHPEVVFAAATTGTTNITASALLRDEADLYRYLTTRIAALTAVTSVESTTVIRLVKGEGLIPPDR